MSRQRIVVYPADSLSTQTEVLDAIVGATGCDRTLLATRLAKGPAVYLADLDEITANELSSILSEHGADFDVEPDPPPPDHVAWLAAEIPKWVRRGFLPPSALPGLHWNYGLEPPSTGKTASSASRPARDPGFLVRAVLTIGAVLVGLGLILFVASNWQRIPSAAKIGGALALTLAALHAGYWTRFVRGPWPRLSATFFVIALFGIGGVLALISQIYHVLPDPYLLPLIWGFLCLPVALLLAFRPALYAASALWLVSYLQYPETHENLPWFYPALLLLFLLPYAVVADDRILYWVHVGLVLVALGATPTTGDFWLATVWLAALGVLAWRDRLAVWDWLLAAGFVAWGICYLLVYPELPFFLYLAPLGFLFHRAWKRRDDWLFAANVAHALVWWMIFLFQTLVRFELEDATPTGLALWALTNGILVYGLGARLRDDDSWRVASALLRGGGALLVLVMAYVMSFRFYEDESELFSSNLFLAAGAAALAIGVGLVLSTARGDARRAEVVVLAPAVLGFVCAAFLPAASPVHVVVWNLTLFTIALVAMRTGHRRQSLLWYNVGIGLFVILITTRYFDTFVDLLPRSVFFVLGGLFLIVWAVLVDRQRRRRVLAGGVDG